MDKLLRSRDRKITRKERGNLTKVATKKKMARFDIFAGVKTLKLDTLEYKKTLICEDEIEADYIADFLAREDYERYAGEFGLLTWQQVRENLKNQGKNYDDNTVDEYYLEEMEDKTLYFARKIENNA